MCTRRMQRAWCGVVVDREHFWLERGGMGERRNEDTEMGMEGVCAWILKARHSKTSFSRAHCSP